MNILKEIKIGGHIYSVKFVDTNDQKKESENWGKCYHSSKEIFIDKTIHQSQQEETLLHEILHCVDQIYNSSELKEEQIGRISEGLYQVIKDNKLFK